MHAAEREKSTMERRMADAVADLWREARTRSATSRTSQNACTSKLGYGLRGPDSRQVSVHKWHP